MANKLIIIHGYSDGATSFEGLRDFFVDSGCYAKQDVSMLSYDSIDDESTFEDFADKLDQDYASQFGTERVDIACHSTGALVARAWLRMHYRRQVEAGVAKPVSPCHHLLMFAPANFGSDLARLGQSFLSKFKMTFNPNRQKEDVRESGRIVLQGLEPASPFQWALSNDDLHGDGYFNPGLGATHVCYPFIFASGKGYGGIQAKLLPARNKPGTDGTVRICGTSLNTRKCWINFAKAQVSVGWMPERKFDRIPFAIFDAYNHGSIVDVGDEFSKGVHSVGALAVDALKVRTFADYVGMASRFDAAMRAKHEGHDYQQFFFRVGDDAGYVIGDYYLDFHVRLEDETVDKALTAEFDRAFKADFTRHSVDSSCRVLMLNVTRLKAYLLKLRAARARLCFDITAQPPYAQIQYHTGYAVVFDGTSATPNGAPAFLFPNTTTLVEVTLNRIQSDAVLHLLDHDLRPRSLPAPRPATSPTGRASLF